MADQKPHTTKSPVVENLEATASSSSFSGRDNHTYNVDVTVNESKKSSESLYPTGVRLSLIIIALCLAIFLTSLDMV
jgi:dolichyl-phosphate-mannose--protein O-mannosyl transferase